MLKYRNTLLFKPNLNLSGGIFDICGSLFGKICSPYSLSLVNIKQVSQENGLINIGSVFAYSTIELD
jgi:hypothetical protein